MEKRLRMFAFEALVCGFSDINTGRQDYGQGIVRVDSRLINEMNNNGHRLSRNDLIRIENNAHDRIFSILRVTELDDSRKIALELDDRFKLRVEKNKIAQIYIRKAYRIEAFQFFWNHSNPTVRIEFKLAVFLTTMSFILGAVVSLMLTL